MTTLVEDESQSSENAAACPGFSGVLYRARISPETDKGKIYTGSCPKIPYSSHLGWPFIGYHK